MTVYKYFLKLALKNKWIIIAYTAIFFMLSIISKPDSSKDKLEFVESNMDIAVVDMSNSELSNALIDNLGSNNTILREENERDKLKELLFINAVQAVVIIPEDFEENVINKRESIEIIRDERRMDSIQISNKINKFLAFSNATYKDNKFDIQKVNEIVKQETKVEVLKLDNYDKNNRSNEWLKSYFNFTGYVIIAIYVSVIGLIMLEINSKDIQDRMKISSKKFLRFNTEIYLGQVTLASIITLVFILGAIVFNSKTRADIQLFKYILNISVFSFSILGFTFFINNIIRNRFIVNAIGTVVSLGTALISGVMLSQEYLGESVLNIAKFFPTYYFVRANETNINSFMDIRYEIMMQLLFGLSFFLMGLYFSKVRRKV